MDKIIIARIMFAGEREGLGTRLYCMCELLACLQINRRVYTREEKGVESKFACRQDAYSHTRQGKFTLRSERFNNVLKMASFMEMFSAWLARV